MGSPELFCILQELGEGDLDAGRGSHRIKVWVEWHRFSIEARAIHRGTIRITIKEALATPSWVMPSS